MQRPARALLRVLVPIAALAAPPTVHAAPCANGTLPPAEAQAAVDFVVRTVGSAHAGSTHGLAPTLRSAFTALRLRVGAGPVPAWRLAADLNGVLALANDGHLAVRLQDAASQTCARVPVDFAWTSAGLFVRGGSGLPLGARVLAVGRHDLDSLDGLAARMVPHENAYWAHAEFARQLSREDFLRTIGAIGADGRVAVQYVGSDGQPAQAALALKDGTASAPEPIASSRFYADDSMGVLRLARLELEPALVEALRGFVAAVDRQGIRKVAIDLRGNPGGDSSVAVAVLKGLGITQYQGFSVDVRVSPELLARQPAFDPKAVSPVFESLGLPPVPAAARHYVIPAPLVLGQLAQRLAEVDVKPTSPRQLFLLVDGGTFSSATLFSLLVRDNALGTLVGEPIGNATDFNGSELRLDIAATPYYLNLSTARLIRPDPVAGPAPTLAPDVLAALSPEAVAAGSDPAVDYVRRR